MNSLKIIFVLLIVIIAVATLTGVSNSAPLEQTGGRTLRFAGLDWYVKAGVDLGPGPNDFSDDPQSVWVDDSGKLHLKLRNIDGTWYSSEVYTTASAVYGTYRFYVETPIQNLDANVVLGLFLYQDLNNEIDVEMARWGDSQGLNAQFVVQPYDQAGHREQYELRWDNATIFEFTWEPDAVHFRSMAGQNPDTALVIHEWEFTQGAIPVENPEMLLRMNLWLNNPPGAPENGQEIEVVVANLESPISGTILEQNCDDLGVEDALLLMVEAQTAIDAENWEEARTKLEQAQAELVRVEGCFPVTSNGIPPVGPTVTSTPTQLTPTVTITQATANRVQGTVQPDEYCTGDYKLALYAGTNHWYVQPFADNNRNVSINADCNWVSDTHAWDYLAVHLVPADYDIPTEVFSLQCPALSDDAILAWDCWEE